MSDKCAASLIAAVLSMVFLAGCDASSSAPAKWSFQFAEEQALVESGLYESEPALSGSYKNTTVQLKYDCSPSNEEINLFFDREIVLDKSHSRGRGGSKVTLYWGNSPVDAEVVVVGGGPGVMLFKNSALHITHLRFVGPVSIEVTFLGQQKTVFTIPTDEARELVEQARATCGLK